MDPDKSWRLHRVVGRLHVRAQSRAPRGCRSVPFFFGKRKNEKIIFLNEVHSIITADAMEEPLWKNMMSCPSFARHRQTAIWTEASDWPAKCPAMPDALVEILEEASAAGVSKIDLRALCVSYGLWPRNRSPPKSGGVKRAADLLENTAMESIVDLVAIGSAEWKKIRVDFLPDDVVADSVSEAIKAYDTQEQRAAAVRKNFEAWAVKGRYHQRGSNPRPRDHFYKLVCKQ